MRTRTSIAGISISQAVSLAGFIIAFITVWVQMEVRIAEVNVEVTNLKQDFLTHKTENRKDMDLLRNENIASTKEILQKVDEIQIYLRNRK